MEEKFRNLKDGDKGSIYTLIIHSSIWLAGIVLILAAVFFAVIMMIMPVKAESAGIRDLVKRVDNLQGEDYSQIKLRKKLGKNGYFEITDDQAKVLYTSASNHKNEYKSDILQYLPEVDMDASYDLVPLENGEKQGWLLMRYEEEGLTGTAVLDENGNIVYNNLDLKSGRISEETMEYLFFNQDEEKLLIQKYAFENSHGEPRYLLIHSDFDAASVVKAQRVTVIAGLGCYILILAILIILMGRRLSGRVVAPIHKLTDAIEQTTGGNWIQIREGEEPKEMLEVIRSFNSMEAALQESEAKQKKLLDQRRKMVADISHDLKTPVTVISGYVNAIHDGLIPEEEMDRYLEIIQNKAGLLTELINSFSDYSRLDHPEFQMNMEEGDLCEYVREYIAERYDELEISGFEVDVELPEDKIYAYFDRMQLKRVFENILGNIMKYCDAGTMVTVSAAVVGEKADRQLRIWIGDNGPGIPEKYRGNIFDPFVVGNESRTSGKGTGLGLSIAKQIVELHRGSIVLTEKPGTVYEIKLPIM